MSDDLVDFGATGPRRKIRVGRMSWPVGRQGKSLPMAVTGAVLAVASLVGPWQRIESTGGDGWPPTPVLVMLPSVATFGIAYLLTMIGAVTSFALVFYGPLRVRETVRLMGMVLAGSALVVVAAAAFTLSVGAGVTGIYFVGDENDQLRLALEWGVLAAAGAAIAIGLAVLWAQTPAPAEPVMAVAPPEIAEPEEDVIDLSVSIHPVGKQLASD